MTRGDMTALHRWLMDQDIDRPVHGLSRLLWRLTHPGWMSLEWLEQQEQQEHHACDPYDCACLDWLMREGSE